MIRGALGLLAVSLAGAGALTAQDPGMAGMQMGPDSAAMMPIPIHTMSA